MGKKKSDVKTDKPGVAKLPAAKKKPSEEKVLAEMQRLAENGIKEFTSTLLRDKLNLDKESGRDQVRRIMKKLEADGKVVITQKQQGKRKRYVYKLSESK